MTAHITHQTCSIDGLIPIQVFQILPKAKKYLLESSFPHEEKGRYSFIGLHPYQEIIGRGKETMLISDSHVEPLVVHQHALHFLQEIMPKIKLSLPLPFYGGAVGISAMIPFNLLKILVHLHLMIGICRIFI